MGKILIFCILLYFSTIWAIACTTPEISPTGITSINPGESVTFTLQYLSNSTKFISCFGNFGDSLTFGPMWINSSGFMTFHTYLIPGYYPAEVNCTNNCNNLDVYNFKILVNNP